MALGTIDPNRVGQVLNAGDTDALFQTLFSGEVMTVFNAETVFQSRHRIRDIQNQKAASFPAIGRAKAAYHTPGTALTGTPVAHNEIIISVDGKLVSDVWIDDVDELKNHFDVRAPYSKQMGQSLANAFDRNVSRVGLQAARAANVITGEPGGTVITNANSRTDAAAIKTVLFQAAQIMDEKNLPSEGRAAFVKPVTFYAAAAEPTLYNKDYDGRGSISQGMIQSLAGIEIVKTNNLAAEDVTAGTDVDGTAVLAKYRANYANTAMLIMQPGAVGTVRLMGISTQMDYDTTFQATHLVARYVMGHGVLRPEESIEVRTAAYI